MTIDWIIYGYLCLGIYQMYIVVMFEYVVENLSFFQMKTWSVDFLTVNPPSDVRRALIILNQPFSLSLLRRLWHFSQWHCCADGGANRLYDLHGQSRYLPDLIKGDLDSIRDDVKSYYIAQVLIMPFMLPN